MPIITHRNIFFGATAVLVALSIVSLAVYGLQFGTDFTGGTLVEIRYDGTRPHAASLIQNLADAGLDGVSVRETGEDGYIIRAAEITDLQRGSLSAILSYQGGTAHVERLTEVGPVIGTELRNKAFIALALVLVCILCFIAFAFRAVSGSDAPRNTRGVSSWVYGLIALVTLVFDVLVPLGFFAALGHLTGTQVDTLFVTAILTILGYSVHDTIVVFDRTRENLRLNHEHNRREDFEQTAGRSLEQTFTRSINTSVTTLVALVALYLVGPESTQYFALTLLVGIVAGTYSSIFFATPLLVAYEKWRTNRKK